MVVQFALFPLVAQANPNAPAPQLAPGGLAFPIALMLALVVFMVLSSRSQKKREKRERDEMYARLSKNDRVLTIGGVIGTVISVKDSEVILKVDESTNTKMTFLKSSVQRIMTEDQSAPAKAR